MSGAGRRAAIKAHLDANGRLDQLEDRLSGTQEAGGSNPPASTTYRTAGMRRDDERGGRADVHDNAVWSVCDHDEHNPRSHTAIVLVLHSKPYRQQGPDESCLF